MICSTELIFAHSVFVKPTARGYRDIVFCVIHSKRTKVTFSVDHEKLIMNAQILRAPVQEHGSPLEVSEGEKRSTEHTNETRCDLVNDLHEDSLLVSPSIS
jgi:hypothetical protein